MAEEVGGTCNVCGGRLRYGERHRTCGQVVIAAVAQERERCAAIADGASHLPNGGDQFANGWCSAALQVAQAIRAGSPSPQPAPAGWLPELTDDALRYAMAALGTGSPAEAARFRAFWLHVQYALAAPPPSAGEERKA
jgi:hypothetical protein